MKLKCSNQFKCIYLACVRSLLILCGYLFGSLRWDSVGTCLGIFQYLFGTLFPIGFRYVSYNLKHFSLIGPLCIQGCLKKKEVFNQFLTSFGYFAQSRKLTNNSCLLQVFTSYRILIVYLQPRSRMRTSIYISGWRQSLKSRTTYHRGEGEMEGAA